MCFITICEAMLWKWYPTFSRCPSAHTGADEVVHRQRIFVFIKIILDKSAHIRYNTPCLFEPARRAGGVSYGGITQLVEYPVHTRYVICSNQIAATRPVGQVVKTPPFHGGNMGSSPVRVTRKSCTQKCVRLFSSFERFPHKTKKPLPV